MKIANVMQIKPLNEEENTTDTENPVDKFSGKYHLPEITIAGVVALLALPKTMTITKKVISRVIPGLGAILQTGTTWDMATQGRWSDALLSAGLTVLNVGQLFGYAAGGAPGAAALVADIAGNLYIYRLDLIKWYYEDIEGMDVSQVPDEELEAAALELIQQMAVKLAEDVGNGVLNAIGMGDETTQGTVAGGDTRMGAASTGVVPSTVAGGDTRTTTASTTASAKPAARTPAQTTTSPASTTPVAATASAKPAARTPAQPIPASAKSTVAPPKMIQPNFDDLSFRKAFASARALAKQTDPENPGSFSFIWRGKPYQTNIKGERFIPQSKQRQLLVPQPATELTEGGRDSIVTSLKGIWDKIGDAVKGVTKGADEAGDVAGAATKSADDIADVVGANVKALPNEHTIDGIKYTYDAATGKWINPADIAVGGRGFAQVPENSLQGRELYKIRSPKIDAAAKAADDAAAAAPKPVEPEAPKPVEPETPTPAKPTPGKGAAIATKVVNWMIYIPAFLEALSDTLQIDPNDPNKMRRLVEIWTKFVAVVGIQKAGIMLGGAAAKKLLNTNMLKDSSKFTKLLVTFLGSAGGYTAAQHVADTERLYGVDNIVNFISDQLFGELDRTPSASQRGADVELGATPNRDSDSLYDKAYRWAKETGFAGPDRFATMVVRQGPNSIWGKQFSQTNESAAHVAALAYLYTILNETTNPIETVKIHKRVNKILEHFNNVENAERFALLLSESVEFKEEVATDNFMTNITAAIAANTKGDKMGAQKALDAAKQSQPATAQDQINQKKVLDQMARTNPGLNIPNTNQNVTEDDPMGAGNDWATTANANDPNAKGTDLLAAYNEFAAKYPAAKFLLDIVPVTGAATSVIDASQDLYNGKYGQAALDILGAIPGFKIGKYISQGLAKAIKAANATTKTANYANATAGLVGNEINESPKIGDHMMLELADGRVVVAPIAELRGNGIVIELDETGNQWLDESPEHHALKIGQNDGHPLSVTANVWNTMIDQLPSDTPSGWAEVFISMQNQTGQPARVMPRLWSQIWRQQHNALGDSLTRVDMANWAEEVGRAMDNSGLVESSIDPSNSAKLKKYLDPKDPAMLAVWMASRAGTKGVPVSKFAKDKAVQSGLPADHWWKKIKKLVQEGAVPTVPRLLSARDIEPLVHFEGDYYIVSHNDGKHLKYDLVKKVVATTDRNTPAYQHVDHLDTGLHRITKEQLRRLANVAMEADKLADGEDDTPDLPDLLGVIAQVMGRKVRKHPDALSTTVKKSDMGYVVSNLLVRHLDGTEAQDLKNALHRAGYNVSKVIINPTTILVILKTTKTTPNTTAMITATPQPDVVGGLAESAYAMEKRYYIVRKDVPTAPVPGMSGYHQKSEAEKKLASMKNGDQYMIRAIDSKRLPKDEIAEARLRDFNFDENDIARIAAMDDLDAAKRYAIKLITGKTRRPMTKEKIMWFTNSINDTKTMNRLVKMLYDMMLSGEGHGVIGDRYSTSKSSYRRQFDEESQRLDPKCWKGYRKQGTKIKDGVRVNNCVKVNEDIDEDEEELYYDAINHMDNLYYCLVEKKFREAATYLSELGHLYQEAGVYLSTAVDMVTDRKVKMHIEKLYGLLDENKDNVIRGILQMIKQYGTSGNEIDNLISVLDDFGVEWPELDAVSNAVAKSLGSDNIAEAEYKGKSVPLNKPIRTSPSEGGKFKVYVKDPKTGNIKMVRFGDTTGLTIKRDDPERRRNFRARHHCDNPGLKTKARYWSCKMWTRKPVGQVLKGK